MTKQQLDAAAIAIAIEFANFVDDVCQGESLWLDEYSEEEGATPERQLLAASRIHGAEGLLDLFTPDFAEQLVREAFKAAGVPVPVASPRVEPTIPVSIRWTEK